MINSCSSLSAHTPHDVCGLMTLTLMVSSGGNKSLDPISVTLKGYVNNVQTSMKVIDYKPGDPRKSDMFAADNLDLSY